MNTVSPFLQLQPRQHLLGQDDPDGIADPGEFERVHDSSFAL
jgi:hypothetical protein